MHVEKGFRDPKGDSRILEGAEETLRKTIQAVASSDLISPRHYPCYITHGARPVQLQRPMNTCGFDERGICLHDDLSSKERR